MANPENRKIRIMKVLIERQTRIFDDLFNIEEALLQYEKFDGKMTPTLRRLKFDRGDSVAALTFNASTKRIVLVSQFRFPTYGRVRGWTREIVAGMIDSNETSESAMRRELLEEPGYRALRLETHLHLLPFAGGSSERVFLYYVEVDNSQKVESSGGLKSAERTQRSSNLAWMRSCGRFRLEQLPTPRPSSAYSGCGIGSTLNRRQLLGQMFSDSRPRAELERLSGLWVVCPAARKSIRPVRPQPLVGTLVDT